MSDAPKDPAPKRVSKIGLYAGGAIIALIISVPAIVAFLLAWKVSGSMFTALIVSILVYFVAMGLSIKVSKKLKVLREDTQ